MSGGKIEQLATREVYRTPAGHGGSPADLAAAELREETGFTAAALTRLGRLHAAYGFCSQG